MTSRLCDEEVVEVVEAIDMGNVESALFGFSDGRPRSIAVARILMGVGGSR
jgi:hypothetical protein